MKFVYEDEITKENQEIEAIYSTIDTKDVMSNEPKKLKIPVFESRDEYLQYKFLNRDLDVEKLVDELYKISDKQGDYEYGFGYVRNQCSKAIKEQLEKEQKGKRVEMLDNATHLDADNYAVITYQNYAGHGDYYTMSGGICTNADVANQCIEELSKMYNKNANKNFEVVDKHGKNLDIEKV